jgi:hypothetical protein
MSPDHGPVYSVAELRSHLAEDRQRWVGRTLLVRGVAVTAACVPPPEGVLCGMPRLLLSDPDPAAASEVLDLAWGPSDPLLTSLRRVPLLGAFLPAPRAIRWGLVATYRAQLRATDKALCGTPRCYEALLLDVSP